MDCNEIYSSPDILEYCERIVKQDNSCFKEETLRFLDEIKTSNFKREIWGNYQHYRFGAEEWGENFLAFIDKRGMMQFQILIRYPKMEIPSIYVIKTQGVKPISFEDFQLKKPINPNDLKFKHRGWTGNQIPSIWYENETNAFEITASSIFPTVSGDHSLDGQIVKNNDSLLFSYEVYGDTWKNHHEINTITGVLHLNTLIAVELERVTRSESNG